MVFMSGEICESGRREGGQINLHDRSEVEYWMQVLDCTHGELINAVKRVGISAEKVRKLLRMNRVA